jgi:hypothetical protein
MFYEFRNGTLAYLAMFVYHPRGLNANQLISVDIGLFQNLSSLTLL